MNRDMGNFRFTALMAAAMLILCVSESAAQDLNKEVYVVRPYEPTLSDASKYNFLPAVTDLGTTSPKFQYSITPRQLENSFAPEPIKAAKTVTTSLPKIYKSWLKIGLGNYSTPMVEFAISNLRSKDYAYGAYLYHKSSFGNIKLQNDDKVDAGYVINSINVYGKRFMSNATLWGNFRFDQHAFSYYGYDTDVIAVPPDLDKDSLRQKTYKPGVEIGIKSTYADPEKIQYEITAALDYFTDKLKNKETSVLVKSTLSRDIFGLLGGLDMSLDYSKLNARTDTFSNTIFRFNPWISKKSKDWHFKLGFEAVADIGDVASYYFYPRANLDIIIIEDVLVPFFGINGELQKFNYQQLFNENQFIKPGLFLNNTSSNLIVYGGLRGNISSVVRFRADLSYTLFKDYHFYVNDTVTEYPLVPLHNQFTAVYDDINLMTYHGQLAFAPSKKLDFTIDGRYFSYSTFEAAKPWHKPDYTIEADASYKVSNKFIIGAGMNVIGNRWVVNYSQPDGRLKMKPVFDLNFTFNYHYSKMLSLFADFYNITERSYMLWNQYPSQRFNFLIGFSYKL